MFITNLGLDNPMKYMLVLALALAPAMAFADNEGFVDAFNDMHPDHRMHCSDNARTHYPSWDPAICTWSEMQGERQGYLHVTYARDGAPTYIEYKCWEYTEEMQVSTGAYVYEDGYLVYDPDFAVMQRQMVSERSLPVHPNDEAGMKELLELIQSPTC